MLFLSANHSIKTPKDKFKIYDVTQIKTNHGCDLCQAALQPSSILLSFLATVHADSQQWRCHKAHNSFFSESN